MKGSVGCFRALQDQRQVLPHSLRSTASTALESALAPPFLGAASCRAKGNGEQIAVLANFASYPDFH